MRKTSRDIIYASECYQIMGLIFNVFNECGHGHKERIYQKAIAETFRKNKINFEEQAKAKLKLGDKDLGIYFLDFIVFGKIVIEIKQKNFFSTKDIKQLYSYLKATGLRLGILVHFTQKGVQYKRIVNIK